MELAQDRVQLVFAVSSVEPVDSVPRVFDDK
jgi:hypothetical protein